MKLLIQHVCSYLLDHIRFYLHDILTYWHTSANTLFINTTNTIHVALHLLLKCTYSPTQTYMYVNSRYSPKSCTQLHRQQNCFYGHCSIPTFAVHQLECVLAPACSAQGSTQPSPTVGEGQLVPHPSHPHPPSAHLHTNTHYAGHIKYYHKQPLQLQVANPI